MFGVFILVMLVFIPVWSAVVLLDDPVYNHFVGSVVPHRVLVACFGVLVLYLVAIPCFFRLSSAEVQTEQIIMSIGLLFISLLGALFMLISIPQKFEGYLETPGLDPSGYCRTAGKDVFGLFSTSQALQALRVEPKCKDLESVELCTGFPGLLEDAALLRDMEDRLMCSGFCYTPDFAAAKEVFRSVNARMVAANPNATMVPLVPTVTSLAQVQARPARSSFGLGGKWLSQRVAALVASDGATSMLDDGGPTLVQQSTSDVSVVATASSSSAAASARGKTPPFPPTLFSRANFQASCDGQAFRHVQAYKSDVASALFLEGVALLFASAGFSLVMVADKCSSHTQRPVLTGASHAQQAVTSQ